MGQILHGCARTTEAVRLAIQSSQESLRVLASRYGINFKTVAKWKKRASVTDAPMGPKNPSSSVLSTEEEAAVVAFRKHTLLPLDDCLYALQTSIPHLTRSSLHRCLQRHGISRLPQLDSAKMSKKQFMVYPIGYFHIDIAEVRTGEGKLYMFVAIDRTSKFAFATLVDKANMDSAKKFLENLIELVPYKIHSVLTDNGIQFADLPKYRNGAIATLQHGTIQLRLHFKNGNSLRNVLLYGIVKEQNIKEMVLADRNSGAYMLPEAAATLALSSTHWVAASRICSLFRRTKGLSAGSSLLATVGYTAKISTGKPLFSNFSQ